MVPSTPNLAIGAAVGLFVAVGAVGAVRVVRGHQRRRREKAMAETADAAPSSVAAEKAARARVVTAALADLEEGSLDMSMGATPSKVAGHI